MIDCDTCTDECPVDEYEKNAENLGWWLVNHGPDGIWDMDLHERASVIEGSDGRNEPEHRHYAQAFTEILEEMRHT